MKSKQKNVNSKKPKKKAVKKKKCKSKAKSNRRKGCGSRRSWRNPGYICNRGGCRDRGRRCCDNYDCGYDYGCGYGYGYGDCPGFGPYPYPPYPPYGAVGGPFGYPPMNVGPYAAFPCATPVGIGGGGGYMVATSCIPTL